MNCEEQSVIYQLNDDLRDREIDGSQTKTGTLTNLLCCARCPLPSTPTPQYLAVPITLQPSELHRWMIGCEMAHLNCMLRRSDFPAYLDAYFVMEIHDALT